jgi:hypothetical protein
VDVLPLSVKKDLSRCASWRKVPLACTFQAEGCERMVKLKLNEVDAPSKWRRRKRFLARWAVTVLLLLLYVSIQMQFSVSVDELKSSAVFMLDTFDVTRPPYRAEALSAFDDMCKLTSRCDPISADEKISYVHISKNAGSSWIQELKRIKNISKDFVGRGPGSFDQDGLYPTAHAGVEHSAPFQDSRIRIHYAGRYRRFVTLRSPRHQVWSLFSQCYYSEWGFYRTLKTNFPRGHPENVLIDFSTWLDHFVTNSEIRKQKDFYTCYHPANYQSRALTAMAKDPHNVVDDVFEPDNAAVVESYWKMDWVSLTSFFHESKCLLYYRIYQGTPNAATRSFVEQYLEETCHCNSHSEKNVGAKDIKDAHYDDAGKRPTLNDMDNAILEKIDRLTRVDRYLYRIALEQFLKEIQWLEANMERRVLCDSVLDKWEHELEYVNVHVKDTYFHRRTTR